MLLIIKFFLYLPGYPFEHRTTVILFSFFHFIFVFDNLSTEAFKKISAKSVFNLGKITWHSGSPILILYSIRYGLLFFIIKPTYKKPL